jgi:dUTP pyrophosphatase
MAEYDWTDNALCDMAENAELKTKIPYFELKIHMGAGLDQSIVDMYKKARDQHNKATCLFLAGLTNEFDAGFDVISPVTEMIGSVDLVSSQKINFKINCAMSRVNCPVIPLVSEMESTLNRVPSSGEFPTLYKKNQDTTPIIYLCPDTKYKQNVGYYLYARSSTGSKTPLRLANHVGIMDSGYRGDVMGVFDNRRNEAYEVSAGQRLLQICPPDISYPTYVIIVNNLDDLGSTSRGAKGFGSSGV